MPRVTPCASFSVSFGCCTHDLTRRRATLCSIAASWSRWKACAEYSPPAAPSTRSQKSVCVSSGPSAARKPSDHDCSSSPLVSSRRCSCSSIPSRLAVCAGDISSSRHSPSTPERWRTRAAASLITFSICARRAGSFCESSSRSTWPIVTGAHRVFLRKVTSATPSRPASRSRSHRTSTEVVEGTEAMASESEERMVDIGGCRAKFCAHSRCCSGALKSWPPRT